MRKGSIAYQFSAEGQAENREIEATGNAFAETAFERGERITDVEREALARWSMFGSDGYPIVKRGRGWVVDHPAAKAAGIFSRKCDAVRQWRILISKWIRMKGLEAQQRAQHGGSEPMMHVIEVRS